MATFEFDPVSRELLQSRPLGVEIPKTAYKIKNEMVIVEAAPKTSSLLVAIMITLIIIMIFFFVFLMWLLFVKTEDQEPTAFFTWLVRRT